MAGDATLDFLARLNDPAQWVIVRDVPIFRPHTRRNQDGSVKYTVSEHDIENIAITGAAKERENGVAGIITLGHRLVDPRAPEPQQPRVVGYLRNMRPGRFGPEQVPCDLVDAYYKRDDWDEARKYPFRSAEYYPAKREITGVALLVRDPELELGVVSYAAPETAYYAREEGPVLFPECYMSQPSDRISSEKAKQILKDDSAKGHPLTEKQKGLFGAAAGREDNMADDPTKPPMGHAPGEGEHPEGVPPEFHEHFMRSMRHHGYPEHYSEIEAKFGHHEGHEGHEHEAAAGYHAGGGAMPGPTNAGVPAAAHHVSEHHPPEHAQRQGQPNAYAALRAEMLAKNRVMEEQLAQERYQRQRSDCERLADQLEYDGYLFNRERFLRDAVPLDERGRLALCKEVQQYSRQDPAAVSQRFIPSAGGGRGLQPFNTDPEKVYTQEVDTFERTMDLAHSYERSHQDKSWDEAVAWAKAEVAKR